MSDLAAVALVYLRLSLLAFGGGVAILPEMQREVVLRHAWLTDAQFRDSYALGQLTPGPGMLMVATGGYAVAGLPGALLAVLCMFLPSSLLTYAAARSWDRLRAAPWRPAVQSALGPVTVGLLLAGAYTIMRTAAAGPVSLAIMAGATVTVLRWRVSPALIIVASALLGLALLR
jgi:chromate transporter